MYLSKLINIERAIDNEPDPHKRALMRQELKKTIEQIEQMMKRLAA